MGDLLTRYRVFDVNDNAERNVSLILSDLQPGEKVVCIIGNIPHVLKVLEVLKDDN